MLICHYDRIQEQMFITINPLMMTIDKRHWLRALFNNNKLCLFWEKKTPYAVNDCLIILTNSVILTQLTDNQMDYHVISNTPFSHGGFSVIYTIDCTLSLMNDNSIKYIITEPLLVKEQRIQHPVTLESIATLKNDAEREYACSKIATHLSIERPIYNPQGDISLLVMKQMPGIELMALLEFIYNDDKPLSWQLLYLLTNELFKAFKEQVLNHRKMHGDLKPENIICNFPRINELPADLASFVPSTLEMKVIDYAFCVNFGEQVKSTKGTALYFAPERYHLPYIITYEKADLFSIGIILYNLWGFLGQTPIPTHGEVYQTMIEKRYCAYFHTQKENFSIQELNEIYQALINMLIKNPLRRSSLREVILDFDAIIKRFHPQEAAALFDQANQYNNVSDHGTKQNKDSSHSETLLLRNTKTPPCNEDANHNQAENLKQHSLFRPPSPQSNTDHSHGASNNNAEKPLMESQLSCNIS